MAAIIDTPPTGAASQDQDEQKYHFNITMTCSGCSGAVDRVLKRLEGVKEYNVNLEEQTADVTALPSLGYGEVLEKIKKTGKKVNSATVNGVTADV